MHAFGIVGIGFAAGVVSGLFGVGGGTLFVPALVLLAGLSQIEAEGTSLVAIVPVAVVGAWSQSRYGNLRLRDALVVGCLAAGGSAGGVALANVLSERALKLGFAAVVLGAAAQLVRRALRAPDPR